MRSRRIVLKLGNFGPISNGELDLKRINIFFGPNNSGKSMTARLIHAFGSMSLSTESIDEDLFLGRVPYDFGLMRGRFETRLFTNRILRTVDSSISSSLMYGQRKGVVKLTTRYGTGTISMDRTRRGISYRMAGSESLRKWSRSLMHRRPGVRRARPSIYVPAARTGIVQTFNTIISIRNAMLSNIIGTLGGRVLPRAASSTEIRRFFRTLRGSPYYLEEFYGLMLEASSEPMPPVLQEQVQTLFGGKVSLKRRGGLFFPYYQDVSGFVSEIERAGSGCGIRLSHSNWVEQAR
jgi:hypothetical protein